MVSGGVRKHQDPKRVESQRAFVFRGSPWSRLEPEGLSQQLSTVSHSKMTESSCSVAIQWKEVAQIGSRNGQSRKQDPMEEVKSEEVDTARSSAAHHSFGIHGTVLPRPSDRWGVVVLSRIGKFITGGGTRSVLGVVSVHDLVHVPYVRCELGASTSNRSFWKAVSNNSIVSRLNDDSVG